MTAEVDTLARIPVIQADGWVLVTRSIDMRKPVPPYRYVYDYKHFQSQNDALDEYALYEADEFAGWSPVGLFPVRQGMPFGPEIAPQMLALMLRERRAA